MHGFVVVAYMWWYYFQALFPVVLFCMMVHGFLINIHTRDHPSIALTHSQPRSQPHSHPHTPTPTQEHALISDDALVLDTFPTKGVAMIGAGYIAVEFAGIFRGFGAQVHLMYRKDLPLRGFDGDVRAAVVDNLKSRGMHLHPNTHPTR